ncbi:MAG TPA: methyltransferase domain-containing protein [Candidatus Dormibacteraeota bacterium]|jgi:SAM-dependent methyltransferase
MGRPSSRETTGYDRALLAFLDTLPEDDEQWGGGLHLEVATRLAGLARPEIGDVCLDIGGGAGIVASALSEAVGPGGSVVSLDASERSIEMARSRAAGNTHLMKMSGDDVVFRDHTFDVVVLSRSIAYASDAYAVIGEASRTLKMGGRLVLFCRRRGLATRAEQAFLDELAAFVQQHLVNLPDQFLGYPGWADRRELELVLRTAGLDDITFGDVVTGGRAGDAAEWNREMMRCWPAARILVGALAGRKRLQFEEQIERVMRTLGDEAFRYHHPYLLATGIRARDWPPTTLDRRPSNPGGVSAVSTFPS